MNKYLLVFLIFCGSLSFQACKKDRVPKEAEQEEVTSAAALVYTKHAFPTLNDPIDLLFDLSLGNGQFKSTDEPLYIHLGLLSNESQSPSDWKFVATDWAVNKEAWKLKKVSGSTYSLTLNPHEFFKISTQAAISHMVMLIRNADGSQVQRNVDGSDIFLSVFRKDQLAIKVQAPALQNTYIPVPEKRSFARGELLTLDVIANKKAKLSLWVGGEKVAESDGEQTRWKPTYGLNQVGENELLLSATVGSETVTQTLRLYVNPEITIAPLPIGVQAGGVSIDAATGNVVFTLIAPGKTSVTLLGGFNDFVATDAAVMNRTADGNVWWIAFDKNLFNKPTAYQFLVDGQLRIADPYSRLILDPVHDVFLPGNTALPAYPQGKTTGILSIYSALDDDYVWKLPSFNRPQPKDLIIYELLLRDFSPTGDFKGLQDSIPYLQKLGINAVELMPVQEFEGNSSWGYNPSFHFAVDKKYGSATALKTLVDKLHAAGIAVILDVVYNHAYAQSPLFQLYMEAGAPASQNPWLNRMAMHPFNVGYDFNHESALTKQFVKDALTYWQTTFKLDGFRFDLSKGFTQKNSGSSDAQVAAWSAYDASRIDIWKDYYQHLTRIDPKTYVILEHFAEDREEAELSAAGMLLWNNLNHAFAEAIMGYTDQGNSSLKRLFKDSHGFAQANMLSYMESHDEERLLYKALQFGNAAGNYSTKNLSTALNRSTMAAAFLLLSPGPKMIWQFGEFGYDVSIDEQGRTGEKPLRWNYLANAARQQLFQKYRSLIQFKRKNPIFRDAQVLADVEEEMKYFILEEAGQRVLVIGNFGLISKSIVVDARLVGDWKDNELKTSSTWLQGQTLIFAPGEYKVLSSTFLNN